MKWPDLYSSRMARMPYLASMVLMFFIRRTFEHSLLSYVGPRPDPELLLGFYLTISAALLAVIAILVINRLHDFDASGWWVTAYLALSVAPAVPLPYDLHVFARYILVIANIPLICMRGTPDENRFGPPTRSLPFFTSR